MTLQLHPYPGRARAVNLVTKDVEALAPGLFNNKYCLTGIRSDDVKIRALDAVFEEFLMRYYIDPTQFGSPPIEESVAYNCGTAFADSTLVGIAMCFGEYSADAYMDAWKEFVEENEDVLDQAGIDSTMIDKVIGCPKNDTYDDYAATAMATFRNGPVGKVPDWNPPTLSTASFPGAQNIIVPKKYVLENPSLETSDIFDETYGSALGLAYFAFGGYNNGTTSDGADSIPASHRNGVYMHFVTLNDTFFENISLRCSTRRMTRTSPDISGPTTSLPLPVVH